MTVIFWIGQSPQFWHLGDENVAHAGGYSDYLARKQATAARQAGSARDANQQNVAETKTKPCTTAEL